MSQPSPEAGRKCPVCGKAAAARFRPFCSKRCADLDLAKWLRGHYAIPVREEDEGEQARVQDGDGAEASSDGD